MKKVGIWIDHRKAVVVSIENGVETMQVIEGDIERHAGPSGGWRTSTPYGPQAPTNEYRRDEHYQKQVVGFYREVIGAIGRPDQLLLMGPADAKREFAKEIAELPAWHGVAVRVEPADKMSDAQVAAMLRAYSFE